MIFQKDRVGILGPTWEKHIGQIPEGMFSERDMLDLQLPRSFTNYLSGHVNRGIQSLETAIQAFYNMDLITQTPLALALCAQQVCGFFKCFSEKSPIETLFTAYVVEYINELVGFKLFELHIINVVQVWTTKEFVEIQRKFFETSDDIDELHRNHTLWRDCNVSQHEHLTPFLYSCQILCYNKEVQKKQASRRFRARGDGFKDMEIGGPSDITAKSPCGAE